MKSLVCLVYQFIWITGFKIRNWNCLVKLFTQKFIGILYGIDNDLNLQTFGYMPGSGQVVAGLIFHELERQAH
jgi:hypothetical protein